MPVLSVRAGDLRQRGTLQAETQTADGSGGYTVSWADVCTDWMSIEPMSGQELVAARQLQPTVTHRIRMRYRTNVAARMRLKFGERLFNIRSVRNIEERNVMLEMTADEGVAV